MTALSTSLRSGIATGGAEGSVRTWLWRHGSTSGPKLLATVREHKKEIVSVAVTSDEAEIMTASKDGTCIIWAVEKCALDYCCLELQKVAEFIFTFSAGEQL